jgi:hypothetical protein
MSYYLILVILSIVFSKNIPIKYKEGKKRISSRHL